MHAGEVVEQAQRILQQCTASSWLNFAAGGSDLSAGVQEPPTCREVTPLEETGEQERRESSS